MSKISAIIMLLAVSLSFYDCAPARFVKPLEKDEWAIGVNAGGPIIEFAEATIPVPFSSIFIGYGKTDRLTIHAGFHTTSFAFRTLQLDAGATYLAREMKDGWPGISVIGSLNTMLDTREYNFRAYPSLAGNLFYDAKYGRFYGGMEQWIDLFRAAVPDGSQHNPWVPAFYVGQTFKLKKWELNFEYKNLAPFSWNSGHVVRYSRRGNRGAHGLYFTVQKRF